MPESARSGSLMLFRLSVEAALRGPRRLAPGAMAVLVLACGSSEPPEQEEPPLTATNGERLVARTLVFPGAAPLLLGPQDQQAGVACWFEQATDGKLRCVPAEGDGGVPEAWVEGQLTLTERPGRLVPFEVHGADGASFPAVAQGLFDRQWSSACSLQSGAEASSRCLPPAAHTVFQPAFSDSGCTQRVVHYLGSESSEPLLALDEGAPHALGPSFSGQIFVRQGLNGACAASGQLGNLRAYELGAPLPADALAGLSLAWRGGGRLALRVAEDTAGIVVSDLRSLGRAVYRDSSLNTPCEPMRTPDGAIRCIGGVYSNAPTPHFFTDSACTRLAVIVNAQKEPTDEVVLVTGAFTQDLTHATAFHRMGAQTDPPDGGFELKDGACVAYTPKVSFRSLEEALPWERFAILREVILK